MSICAKTNAWGLKINSSCFGTRICQFSYLASRVLYFPIQHSYQKQTKWTAIQVGMSVHLLTFFHISHKCHRHNKIAWFKWQCHIERHIGILFCVAPLCVWCWVCLFVWWKGSDTELYCSTVMNLNDMSSFCWSSWIPAAWLHVGPVFIPALEIKMEVGPLQRHLYFDFTFWKLDGPLREWSPY